MKKQLFHTFLLGVILCFTWSCADDQNFDQIDDLSVEPLITTSIFYFESDEGTINAAPVGTFYIQDFTFDAFNENFVADNLLEGSITYQLENTTSKSLAIVVEFLDASGAVLDEERFNLLPEQQMPSELQVNYGVGGKSLDILRNTTNIRVRGDNLSDNTSVSNLQEPKVILRTSAEFRLKLQ